MPQEPKDPRSDEQVAYEYAKAAKACVDHGVDSPDCRKELIGQGVKAAAIAYGMDPEVAAAAEQCLASGDSEVCAKASAKLAATAACTFATEGAGGPLCAKLAPFVVDAIWPLAGPPLVAAWDMAWGFTDGVLGGIVAFAKALLEAAGIDLSTDADPTVMDVYWELLSVGQRAIVTQWDVGAQALQVADDESRKHLHLPMSLDAPPNPNLIVGLGGPVASSAGGAVRNSTAKYLESWLLAEPGWTGAVYVRVRYLAPGEYDFEVRDAPFQNWELGPKDKRVTLGAMPQGMKKLSVESPTNEQGEGWTPWNLGFDRFNNERKLLSEAYFAALVVRVEALKRATTNAVGSIVAQNTERAEQAQQDFRNKMARGVVKQPSSSGGSVAVPLVLAGLVAAGLGYYSWRKGKV